MKKILTLLCALALVGIAAAQAPGTSVAKTVGQTVTITASAPSAYTNGTAIASGTAITYNLYQQSGSGTAAGCAAAPAVGTPVASALTSPTWTSPALTAVGSVCWVMTDVIAGVESAPSNVVTAVVSAATPNPPAGATIK